MVIQDQKWQTDTVRERFSIE